MQHVGLQENIPNCDIKRKCCVSCCTGEDSLPPSKTIDMYSLGSTDGQYGTGDAARKPQWLRITITDTKSKMVKLNARFPAGFLDSVASIVPQVVLLIKCFNLMTVILR